MSEHGNTDDELTRVLIAAPADEFDEPTTILQPPPPQEFDEPTTIVQAPEPEPLSAPFTASGPVLPDFRDDELTTVIAPPATADTFEAGDVTELMPSHAPPGGGDPDQPWFDGLLTAFIGGLRCDEHGQPRPAEERQALAAAARDTIARVAIQGIPGHDTSGTDWASGTVLQPDQLLANTYVVRALIARGGVGEIYRTRHRDLKTEHAIKILLPQYALVPTMLTLMLEEARLLQCVRHEAVVGCQGLLRDTDGRPMLVMDHLRGRTLSNRLRGGRLPDADLLALTLRLAAGLAAIHDAGIVHQDISPDNVILADDSCAAATIIDFGLARRMDGTPDIHGQLDFAGKFSWSSPEQLSGRPAALDARSDLYSLGLMLAAAARGHRLEMGHDLESARAARTTIPSMAGIDEPMAGLIERLLAPAPHARLGSAREIPAMLERRRHHFMPLSLLKRFRAR